MKRTFQHKKKKHGKKVAKRLRRDSDDMFPLSQAELRRFSYKEEVSSEAESESGEAPAVRMTGVITKLGEVVKDQRTGLVTFTLKDGQKTVGRFAEDQTVANNYRLAEMRELASDESLSFPLRVGMPVKVLTLEQARARVQDFSYRVQVEIGGPDGPGTPILLEDLEGKEIANLDGESVSGTVTFFGTQDAVATFHQEGGEPKLAHFDVRSILLNGLTVNQSAYNLVIYDGMTIPLKITSSAMRKIPGIYYRADCKLDLPVVSEGKAAIQDPPEEFIGVVVKAEKEVPVLLSCTCVGGGNFFVTCERVTVGGGPVSDSSLHFGEGTRVVASLQFAQQHSTIEAGHVYSATVDMPLKTGTIKKLIFISGIAFPRSVEATVHDDSRLILIQKSGIKVNGSQPKQQQPSFPKHFFRLDMEIELNDVWMLNETDYRGTMNVSTNILTKDVRVEDSTPACTVRSPKKEHKVRKVKYVQGVISVVRSEAPGLVLPSEVTVMFDGEERKVSIPPDQVIVNNKTDVLLSSARVQVGSKAKVYNLVQNATASGYQGKLIYSLPRKKVGDWYCPNPKQQPM